MIPGIAPAISKKKAGPDPGGGYSFTMTAGNFSNVVYGYSNGDILPAFGSINGEPVPGETLLYIISDPSGVAFGTPGVFIVFDGDIVTLLATKILYVGGIPYTPSVDWTFDNSITVAQFTVSYPEFEDSEVYPIQLK